MSMSKTNSKNSGNLVNSKIDKFLNINFEIVLIVVLIIVAILLICFLNRKYDRTNNLREHPITEPFYSDKATQLHLFYAKWCKHSKEFIKVGGVSDEIEKKINEKIKDFKIEKINVDDIANEEKVKAANVQLLPSLFYYKYDSKGKEYKYEPIKLKNNGTYDISEILKELS